MTGRTGLVCVVGSLNDDTTLTVATLPAPGETTLTEGERLTSPGGKGANQAAAAAVLGARVAMVGAVGDDEPGARSLAALRDLDVDLAAVAPDRGRHWHRDHHCRRRRGKHDRRGRRS
jgi:ribokinase